MSKLPWAIAYRPKAAKDFLFQDEHAKALVSKFIEEQNIPHLLLSGHRGTGKSSLVSVLKHEIEIDDMDYLYLNASLDNSVDIIRTKVLSFVNTFAMSAFKMVYMDEADRLTPSAQDALKSMMEDYAENARFVLTCNKPHKIIPELKSRCQEIVFKSLDKEEVFQKAAKILKKEKVTLDEATYDLIEKYIDATFPDFRKLLNVLQQKTINGVLTDSDDGADGGANEFNVTMLEMMEKGQWAKIRPYMSENTPDDQWEEVYRFLYDYISELPAFEDAQKTDEAIITIADHLYKNNFVADSEINFAACIIKLSRIAKR